MLVFLDLTLLYLVDHTNLINMTPHSVSSPTDNHFYNIYRGFIFRVFNLGWLYMAAIVIYNRIVTSKVSLTGIRKVFIGISISVFIFLFTWLFELETDVLLQGLVVYPVLGISLVYLHKLFFEKQTFYVKSNLDSMP
jgi:hypothetical protein